MSLARAGVLDALSFHGVQRVMEVKSLDIRLGLRRGAGLLLPRRLRRSQTLRLLLKFPFQSGNVLFEAFALVPALGRSKAQFGTVADAAVRSVVEEGEKAVILL